MSKVLEEAGLRIAESVGEMRGTLTESIKNQDKVNDRLTTIIEKQGEKIEKQESSILKIERRLLIALVIAVCLCGDKIRNILQTLPW